MEEKWKWIKGFEGDYQISNFGRLKSFRGNPTGYILKQTNKNGWYFTVNLYKDNRKYKTERIHRLVALHFIGEIPKGFEVNHIDGNKQNNRVDNLEIISKQEHTNKTMSQRDYISKMVNHNLYKKPRRIRQLTLDGYFVAEYANAQIASNYTGVCARNILQVADKKPFNLKGNYRKQAGGYVWEFSVDKKGGD